MHRCCIEHSVAMRGLRGKRLKSCGYKSGKPSIHLKLRRALLTAGIQTPACKRSRQPACADRTRFEVLSVPPTVARALAVAAIAFPICHLVMEAKATTRGVSVKKRTWTCMHVVGTSLYKRVFWEYPTTYQHNPHHHHQLHDRNQYLSSSSIFGSRVHQEDQGPSPVLSVVRGGWVASCPTCTPD